MNPRGHDEDPGRVNLTPRNPSKTQSSKTISTPARQNRKPPPSSDRDEHQKTTLQKSPMKFSVQLERETDDEYENEADDDLHLSP